MSRVVRRGRHRPTDRPRHTKDVPARADSQPAGLLQRLLDIPHLAEVVPRLHSQVLYRVIQTCGLEDCAELVAAATPQQLTAIFDVDLWQAAGPGGDEQLDVGRFGVWLEVLMESGASAAAAKVAALDPELVTAALAQHIRVFDVSAVALPESTDGSEPVDLRRDTASASCELAGYHVEARREDYWHAIVDLLASLDASHPDRFHEVMRGCRALSNSAPEVDGLDDLLGDAEQDLFDLAIDREKRREAQGFVSSAQARAFLRMARQFTPMEPTGAANPSARAYFRAIEPPDAVDGMPSMERRAELPSASGSAAPEDDSSAMGAVVDLVVDLLLDAGIVPQSPRGLLEAGPAPPRLARLHSHLDAMRERDPAACAGAAAEMAYLANVLVAGGSLQGRAFTPREASDAVAAACNLGLEHWPDGSPPDDLVMVFQAGWTVLHRHVSMRVSRRLIALLDGVRHEDPDIQRGLRALQIQLARHAASGEPWRARDALDVIMILDMPAWAALVALVDECPVVHAGIAALRSRDAAAIDAAAFEFIADRDQIAAVDAFMESLPDILRG